MPPRLSLAIIFLDAEGRPEGGANSVGMIRIGAGRLEGDAVAGLTYVPIPNPPPDQEVGMAITVAGGSFVDAVIAEAVTLAEEVNATGLFIVAYNASADMSMLHAERWRGTDTVWFDARPWIMNHYGLRRGGSKLVDAARAAGLPQQQMHRGILDARILMNIARRIVPGNDYAEMLRQWLATNPPPRLMDYDNANKQLPVSDPIYRKRGTWHAEPDGAVTFVVDAWRELSGSSFVDYGYYKWTPGGWKRISPAKKQAPLQERIDREEAAKRAAGV